jgi:hypothetical protein
MAPAAVPVLAAVYGQRGRGSLAEDDDSTKLLGPDNVGGGYGGQGTDVKRTVHLRGGERL